MLHVGLLTLKPNKNCCHLFSQGHTSLLWSPIHLPLGIQGSAKQCYTSYFSPEDTFTKPFFIFLFVAKPPAGWQRLLLVCSFLWRIPKVCWVFFFSLSFAQSVLFLKGQKYALQKGKEKKLKINACSPCSACLGWEMNMKITINKR